MSLIHFLHIYLHRRGNFYCNSYSIQGEERKCQKTPFFSLCSSIHSLPRGGVVGRSSHRQAIGDMCPWASESRTRLSACFTSAFRWSSFSCQRLYLHRGHPECPVLSVTSQKVHQGEPGVCFYQPFSMFPLGMCVGHSPTIILGHALESEYGWSTCRAGSDLAIQMG